jgi:hypothetical protein
MALYSVGRSSFGELRGVEQFVTDRNVAAQVNSLIAESRDVFAGGAVLSVNEAVRSRRSQEVKRAAWNAYQRGGPWAPLAAVLYTSTHDESKGSALDFGVTNANGSNRALTMSEHSWLVTRGAQRGIRWTGKDFRPTPESWHFNGGYPATITASSGATPFPVSEEDDMPTAVEVANEMLDNQRVFFRAGTVSVSVREALARACDAADTTQFLREVFTAPGEVNGGRAVIDKTSSACRSWTRLPQPTRSGVGVARSASWCGTSTTAPTARALRSRRGTSSPC